VIKKMLAAFAMLCFALYFVKRFWLFELPGEPTDYSVVGFMVLAIVYFLRGREPEVA